MGGLRWFRLRAALVQAATTPASWATDAAACRQPCGTIHPLLPLAAIAATFLLEVGVEMPTVKGAGRAPFASPLLARRGELLADSIFKSSK